jgi:hypothetical protein
MEKLLDVAPIGSFCIVSPDVREQQKKLVELIGGTNFKSSSLVLIDLDNNEIFKNNGSVKVNNLRESGGRTLPLNVMTLYRISQAMVVLNKSCASGFLKSLYDILGFDVFLRSLENNGELEIPTSKKDSLLAYLHASIPEYVNEIYTEAGDFNMRKYIAGGFKSPEFLYCALLSCNTWLNSLHILSPNIIINLSCVSALVEPETIIEMRHLSALLSERGGRLVINAVS